MGISGKMEESGKQRQTNLRIVRGNPIGMVRKKKKPSQLQTLRGWEGEKTIHRVRPWEWGKESEEYSWEWAWVEWGWEAKSLREFETVREVWDDWWGIRHERRECLGEAWVIRVSF